MSGADREANNDGQGRAAEGRTDGRAGEGKARQQDKPRNRLPLIIAIAAVIAVLIVYLIYWLATRNEVSTDDAYTDGRAISIAANVSGYVTALNVNDNSFVHQGELLAVIDPREDQAAMRQAQANLLFARAQLASAETDLVVAKVRAPAQLVQAQAQLAQAEASQRQTSRNDIRQRSVDPRATTASNIDLSTQQFRTAQAQVQQAQAQVDSASLVAQQIQSAEQAVQQRQAQLVQAQANLAQAQVKLSYNEIRAPQDGRITMRNVELGTYVQAGAQIFFIVTPQTWVIANFKETQLTRLRPGQHVDITVDAYPGLKLSGHVDSIQQGSGARFTTFPAENATGNFVKIVRRVPVKIIIDHGLPADMHGLPLGISVGPTVDVK